MHENGKIVAGKKHMGSFPKAVEKFFNEGLARFSNANKKFCFVGQTRVDNDLFQKQVKKFKDAGFENVVEAYVGCTITIQVGKNCIGYFVYTGNEYK